MSRQSLQLELAERPKGPIVPGRTFRIRKVPAPSESDLRDGQLLLETLYVSFDPAMRGWLDDRRSYIQPVQIGEVMRALAVCRVLASRSSKAGAGEIVTAPLGIRRWGLSGRGDWDAEEGDTVVVSAAAGATGSVAVQIAKIAGARVIGTAGSEKKCRWLREELGLDVALNYKDPEFRAKFKEATPKYIDVFFDNVGGEQLDMALGRANTFARFVMCGGISQYNAESKSGPTKNFFNIITQRIKMEGFIVFDYASEYGDALKQIAQWLAEGKMKRKETIIKGGVGASEEAFQQLFQGGNIGKLMVEVKNPDEVSRL
ncbi:hypothetical protein N0V88_005714 [Collariella sp. IMI 366227]|nr:hypothetical protein N0V88_005714 [Collariella sp. IMI 366227]